MNNALDKYLVYFGVSLMIIWDCIWVSFILWVWFERRFKRYSSRDKHFSYIQIPSKLLLLRINSIKLTKDDHDGGKVPIVIIIINY